MFTLTVHYYDGPSITSECVDDLDEALQDYIDADWAACHAPSDQVGDVRQIILRHEDKIIRQRSYP
jgi:hypothetical protein